MFNPTSADRFVEVELKSDLSGTTQCDQIGTSLAMNLVTLFKCYFDTRPSGTSGRKPAQYPKVEGSSLDTAVDTGREKTAGGGGGGMVNKSV